MKRALLALAAFALIGASGPVRAADAPASDAEFKAQGCNACHVPGEADQAPPLEGVYGRKIAGAPNWPYCDSLKAKTGTWDDATLDAFLKDTQAFAPGCAMVFKIDDAKKRAAIIGYLKTLK
jgi:cytochrome c